MIFGTALNGRSRFRYRGTLGDLRFEPVLFLTSNLLENIVTDSFVIATTTQDQLLGAKHRKTSIILGVISLFVLGLPLGIMALINARKAEAYGVKATAGKVLGVIGFVSGAIVLGVFVLTR